jgi:hypothetical protein
MAQYRELFDSAKQQIYTLKNQMESYSVEYTRRALQSAAYRRIPPEIMQKIFTIVVRIPKIPDSHRRSPSSSYFSPVGNGGKWPSPHLNYGSESNLGVTNISTMITTPYRGITTNSSDGSNDPGVSLFTYEWSVVNFG